jgi:CubicO group peptidase (beta-lactamase class C family)
MALTGLQDKTESLADEHHVPGVAVGVFCDGEERYAYHGVTSVENPLAVGPSTLFQVGSITKTYTATAIMALAKAGEVGLDDPVRTYVPELRLKDEAAAQTVTVGELLNHSAGWNGDYLEDTGDGEDAIAKYVQKMAQLEQVSPPGAVAAYNNAAYVLAGRLIEKVTGQAYEAAIKRLILEPLGCTESFFFAGEVMTRRFAVGHGYAVGHGCKEQQAAVTVARPLLLPRNSAPAGGLFSTARDQIRYARFHLGQAPAEGGAPVLARETLDRMKTPTISMQGGTPGDWVGISWMLRDIDGVRVAAHDGSTNGQQSALEIIPERNFAVTVLTNSATGLQMNRELVKWAQETYLGLAEKEPPALALDETSLLPFTGRYVSDTNIIDISPSSDGGLILKLSYTPAALEMSKVISNEPPEPSPATTIRMTGDEQYTISDGQYKGMKGNFVRTDGRITGINLIGRLAVKR